MASGRVCAIIGPTSPVGSSSATEDVIIGGSTITERIRVIDFDGTTAEYIDIPIQLVNYNGGGITVSGRISWSTSTTITQQSRIEADIRVLETSDNPTSLYTYTFGGTSVNVTGTLGLSAVFSMNIADEAGMADDVVILLRMRRDPAHVDDNATGDTELWIDSLLVKEQ